MNVSVESTQLPAQELISYEGFVNRIQSLAASSRVKVHLLGRSHGGRGLYAIVIADEMVVPNLDQHKELASVLQRPLITHTTLTQWQKGERPTSSKEVKYPVLLLGESFGHEAAHVEALLELGEKLAWGKEREIKEILSHLIVLLMPMVNPDGREKAIELWKRYPLAEDSAAGNLYGFYLNRDFLHLTQPESKAVIRLFREWHPLALLDLHEDVFLLGVETPEVCWCPAFGAALEDEAPENIQEIVTRLGRAIQKEWSELGYNYYHGDMFAYPMPGQSPDEPHWKADGNIVQTMTLHGIPAVITESARTPGTQSWQDRVQQKVSAGMALLEAVAREADAIADIIYKNCEDNVAEGLDEAFVIPKEQHEAGAISKLIDTLLQQGVRVYQIGEPDEAFIVPLSQPEAKIAQKLLSIEQSKLAAMPPALGIRVIPLSGLSVKAKRDLERAPLKPVFEAPLPFLEVKGDGADLSHMAIPNTLDGVRLLNRLWHVGSPIYWLAQPIQVGELSLAPGTFVVEKTPSKALEMLSRDLYLRLVALPSGITVDAYSLRKPVVMFYVGQGVDRPDSSAMAEVWWALERMGFDFWPLWEGQIREEWLARGDILLIPDGDAYEIVHGWRRDSPLNSPPWELPGEPSGIGEEGLEAIGKFIESGGGYIGIGAGGGVLAAQDYAGFLDLHLAYHSLGTARVMLRINLEHPLVYGLNGYYNKRGEWEENLFPAFYHSEAMTGVPGGPIFKVGKRAKVIAYYSAVDHDPSAHQVVHANLFSEETKGVALAFQEIGKGMATVVGVRPGFRGLWTNTYKILSNAIFYGVAGELERITLP